MKKNQTTARTFLMGQAHATAVSMIYPGSMVTGLEENIRRRKVARDQIIALAEQLKIEAAQGCV